MQDAGARQPLTDLEAAFLAYDHACVSNVVAAAEVEGPIDAAIVAQALDVVASRHPYLTCRIEEGESGPELVQDVAGKVPLVLEAAPGGSWPAVCDVELKTRVDTARAPMMRARLLGGAGAASQLIVSLPHVISDGMSVIQLMGELLREIERLSLGLPLHGAEPRRVRRPDTAHLGGSGGDRPVIAVGRLDLDRFSVGSERPPVPAPPSVSPPPGRTTSVLPVRLAPPESRRLLEKCERTGVPLNAAVTAALVFAMRAHAGSRGAASTPSWIKISSAVDLRRRLRRRALSPADLGMWATRCVLYAGLASDADPAAFGRAFHRALMQHIRRVPPGLATRAALGVARPAVPMAPSDSGLPHVKVTNMGDFDRQGIASRYGPIELRNLHVMTSFHRDWIDDLGFAVIPSVFGGCVNLVWAYMKPARTEEEAGRFAESVLGYLLQ